MIKKHLNSELFTNNRKRLEPLMERDSAAVLFSNDMMPRNGDQHFPFRQNSDLFYLSGIDQEETILVLFPDCPLEQFREILFIKKTNEHIATWEGHKYTMEEAREISGIKNVLWTDAFEGAIIQISTLCSNIYLNQNEHWGAPKTPESLQMREGLKLQKKYPFHTYHRLAPLLTELRLIKQQQEIDTIRHACNITAATFDLAMKYVRPGLNEYQVEAEITHEFLKSGASGHAYAPIVASGKNATILHYIDNNSNLEDGDLILFDIGCEYDNYASDLSRTIPVNGKFTTRQKEVYNAVLHVFKQAREMMKPGITIDAINKQVEMLLMHEHIKLGLYSENEIQNKEEAQKLVKKYYPHGTSHFMGLDVHDVGTKYERLEAGMILTCEPGIYIAEEKLGIRIENDILITLDEPVDLMENIPIEADEIEKIMASH